MVISGVTSDRKGTCTRRYINERLLTKSLVNQRNAKSLGMSTSKEETTFGAITAPPSTPKKKKESRKDEETPGQQNTHLVSRSLKLGPLEPTAEPKQSQNQSVAAETSKSLNTENLESVQKDIETVKTDIEAVKSDIKELKSDIKSVDATMKSEIQSIIEKVKSTMSEVVSQAIQAEIIPLKNEVESLRTELRAIKLVEESNEGVRIHAINVGQGDCILVEFYQDDTTTHCYLIDGGRRVEEKKPTERSKQHFNNKMECLEMCNCPDTLKTIIVTHPDQDHHQGITQLLKQWGDKFQGDILVTEQFQNNEELKKGTVNKFLEQAKKSCSEPCITDEDHLHRNALETRLHCYMNKVRPMLYKSKKPVNQDPSLETNDTSIITTIDGDNIVLTGDSRSAVIEEKLKLSRDTHKHFKIFQVPHHGSKNNSNEEFYKKFTADIYLISGGGHDGYDHPSAVVLQAIIRANALHHKRKCIIVVTNSYQLRGDKLLQLPEKKTLSPLPHGWWEWVTIYHAEALVDYGDETAPISQQQWVTLDPSYWQPGNPLKMVVQTDDRMLVEWTPRGYVDMIRRKIQKHCRIKTDTQEYRPFRHRRYVTINQQDGKTVVDAIIAVPTPHQPWIKDCLNLCYVRERTLTTDEVLFLELLDQTPRFRQYSYNPSGDKLWTKSRPQELGDTEILTGHEAFGEYNHKLKLTLEGIICRLERFSNSQNKWVLYNGSNEGIYAINDCIVDQDNIDQINDDLQKPPHNLKISYLKSQLHNFWE